MILQQRGETRVVYMPDIDAGHIVLGESMGICDIQGKPALHAMVKKMRYTTDCGVAVDAWNLVGQTVNFMVVPDRVKIEGAKSSDFAKALNSFNSPKYTFGRYVFTGKFNGADDRYTVSDKMGRKMTTSADLLKDLPGIFALMANLDHDGGAIFHPVIARYLWFIWHMKGRPSKFQPVGYFDLHRYLQVLKDDRRHMFSRQSGDALIDIQFGKEPYVVVTGIDPMTNQAIIELKDVTVIDRSKDDSFKPYVLVANRPFELRQEVKFEWKRVVVDKHPIFLMPVMCLHGTWRNMLNMFDLLSTTQIQA